MCCEQSLPSTPEGREEVVPARDDGGETTGPTVLGMTHAVPGHGTQGREREGEEVHECNMWVGMCNVCRWGVYMCVWMRVHVPYSAWQHTIEVFTLHFDDKSGWYT